MNNEINKFLPRDYVSSSIMVFLILLFTCFLLFTKFQMSLLWILLGVFEVFYFFYFSSQLTKRWADIPEHLFKKKVFKNGIAIRIVYVVIVYFFYELMTGVPFEFSAADSLGYHGEALWMIDLLDSGQLSRYFNIYLNGYSDMGFPVFLFLNYIVFGVTLIIPRLINAFLGAWMCLIIYKLAKRNFGETSARITTILVMLLPNFIFYTGLHLKETLMVFLLVLFFERAERLFRESSHYFINLFWVSLIGISLFMFRTVLAATAWFAFFSMVTFTKERKAGWAKRFMIAVWLVLAFVLVFPEKVSREIDYYLSGIDIHLQSQMQNFSTREGGNKFAEYGKSSIFIPIILVAPFPTLVDTGQPNASMISGAVYTRNIYAFFVLIALFLIYKRKLLRKHMFIISFLFAYLAVLSNSGFAISERFHLPAVPFMLILAGFGISEVGPRFKKYYFPYLLVIGVLIIAWNWFKLAGRNFI